MSNAECLVLLVGDDPPQDPQAEQEVENLLYCFLKSLLKRRLWILAAQGEGL